MDYQNKESETKSDDPGLVRLKYVQDCYTESFFFLQERKRRQVRQLVLLNNLQRGDQNIASTLLLTLFNRVLSSLYDDKLQVKALPTQGILQEQINSYNVLAQSDYLEMQKAKLDYDWIWDALFFGRGYMETLRFNKKRKIMEPAVINPLVFGYDPYFENNQDWRYYWKWITKSKNEINRLIKNEVITTISSPEEIMGGVDEYLWNYKEQRDKAKKAVEPSADSMGGDIFQILEFYAYDEDGDKCVYWLDRGFTKILWHDKLDLDDLEYLNPDGSSDKKKGSKWPIVVKEAFREPHSSVSFSVADLLEDKHRAKSVLLNLAFLAAKDRANPIYGYNPDKVRDVTQFFSRQINQHIPMDDETAAWPLNTEDPMSQGLMQFISMLTTEANDPVGTGNVGQPERIEGEDTATGRAIDQQLNDMAQSLQSKVMQFGESEFWSHWFHRYAKYGPELKEKMANIVGVNGISTQMIEFEDFNTNFPPGFLVYSAKEAEYKNLVKRRDFMTLYPNLMQSLDPDGFRNFNKHVFMPLMLEDPSLIDIMFPKTLDEIKSEEENEQLKQEQLPEALPTDNHQTHIYTHQMVQPKTWAMWFHISEHERLLAEQKAQEQAAMAAEQAQVVDSGGSQPSKMNIGKEKRSPIAASSPLKTEINPQMSQK